MKHILLVLALAATASFATLARVESMGKRSAFFLDDVSMFDNPANATFYPNALIGELGFYRMNSLGYKDVGNMRDPSLVDPLSPWFGALFRYGLSDDGLRDPQITIGGFFGRDHNEFQRFVPREVDVGGRTYRVPSNVTNFDAFLAGTMIDGSAVGAHIYVAVQDGKEDDVLNNDPSKGEMASNAHVSILAMDYGANFLITNSSSMEVSLGIARIQYGPSRKTFLDPGLFSFYSQGRLFLEMDAWNGQFVTGYKIADMEVPGWEETSYGLNAGINKIIPRGLFWFGLDAIFVQETVSTWGLRQDERGNDILFYREPLYREQIKSDRGNTFGGAISFGIERNVFKDWLVLRTGGMKSFAYKTCTINSDRSLDGSDNRSTICKTPNGQTGKGNYWATNPIGDGSLDDHLGLGIGINLENKLKIDATVAEDALLRNPFVNGPGRIISRVSAMYTF